MGEPVDAVFDAVNEEAWTGFRARLADHVAELADDDVLVVDTVRADEPTDGAAPYVQLCGWGGTSVRGEVSSNSYLAPSHALDDEAVQAVLAIGWHPPKPTRKRGGKPGSGPSGPSGPSGSENFFVDLERVEADRLAVMTVRVLREVFGVVHPSFLRAGGLEVDPSVSVAEPGAATPAADEPLAVLPADRDELVALVDDALTPYFGHVPRKDDDGDIPVVTDSTIVFVRVLPDLPIVHLFCRVVRSVTDRAAARFETGVLNRDGRFVRFSLVGDDVMATIDLPAMPFAPGHLRDMLEYLCSSADGVVDDLLERVGGHRDLEGTDEAHEGDDADDLEEADEGDEADDDDGEDGDESDDDEDVHPAMLTLLQLDADRPGSVTAELAASICGWDRDLVLELITWNSVQEIAWRQARDRASAGDDEDEAEVCEVERAHAEGSVALLRRALRLVVEAQLARHRAAPGPAARRPGARRARAEDPPAAAPEGRVDPGLLEARPTWLEGGRG